MATWLNLFKNDKKTEEDNQPLYRNVKVVFENDVNLTAGIPYEVALWKKDKTNKWKNENAEKEKRQVFIIQHVILDAEKYKTCDWEQKKESKN